MGRAFAGCTRLTSVTLSRKTDAINADFPAGVPLRYCD
jgi:hypothetical protein